MNLHRDDTKNLCGLSTFKRLVAVATEVLHVCLEVGYRIELWGGESGDKKLCPLNWGIGVPDPF